MAPIDPSDYCGDDPDDDDIFDRVLDDEEFLKDLNENLDDDEFIDELIEHDDGAGLTDS